MRIAIPTMDGSICPHFGHCSEFTLIDVDVNARSITGRATVPAPPHQPGLLPRWLAEQGANLVIAGGMGARAQDLFAQNGIKVVIGVTGGDPEGIVRSYLNGTLQSGENLCDH
jgi:ATP-binding protein involved in chromosome partitioning